MKKRRGIFFFQCCKMTAIDISTKIWRQISEPDCLSSRSDGKLLSKPTHGNVPCQRLLQEVGVNTDPQPLAFLFGFRMVNFLTILFRGLMKKRRGIFSFFSALQDDCNRHIDPKFEANFEPDCLSSRSDGKLLSNQRMGMSHARGCCRRLGVILTPNLSLSYSGFRMVNFLTILFRGLMKKRRGIFSFQCRKMTAIDISTKIWRQISEPDCLSSRSDGKLLSNQRMGMSHARGCCRRLGVILTPNLSLSYSGFRDG